MPAADTEPDAPAGDAAESGAARERTLVIACGALAHELKAITDLNGLDDITVECLPAALHNRPKEIPEAVRARIRRARAGARPGTGGPASSPPALDSADLVEGDVDGDGDGDVDGQAGGSVATFGDRRPGNEFDRIFIGYADCGTGGMLARVCEEEQVEMLDGAHCYEFFATSPRFAELQDHELGSFYLTDFFVKHFERIVWQGLGIEKHPELLPMYFGNYTRLVYLAQTDDPSLVERAEAAAARLGLSMIVERTGYGDLRTTIVEIGTARR